MANTYENPMSLLPKNDFVASGPLGGALAGLQTMYGIGGLEAGQRDQDLSYLDKLNTYENTLADNPTKVAERALKLSELSDKQKLQDTGLPYQEAATQKEAAIAQNKAVPTLVDAQKKVIAAGDVDAAFRAMENISKNPSLAQDQNYVDSIWGHHSKVLQNHGINIPSKWDQTTAQVLAAHMKAAEAKLPLYHDIMKQHLKTKDEKEMKDVTAAYTADKHLEGVKYAADKAAEAKKSSFQDSLERTLYAKPEAMIAYQLHLKETGDEKFSPRQLVNAISVLVDKNRAKIDDTINRAKASGRDVSGLTDEEWLSSLNPVHRQLIEETGLLGTLKQVATGTATGGSSPKKSSDIPKGTIKTVTKNNVIRAFKKTGDGPNDWEEVDANYVGH